MVYHVSTNACINYYGSSRYSIYTEARLSKHIITTMSDIYIICTTMRLFTKSLSSKVNKYVRHSGITEIWGNVKDLVEPLGKSGFYRLLRSICERSYIIEGRSYMDDNSVWNML